MVKVSTDTPKHSYPGVVHEYQMNIDLKGKKVFLLSM